ncbi:hypothetical protein MNB_SV-13-1528 [hydrothermal vent metagenome]|uniref:Uncharacterized protein n=1 Tax=hydrothermal vent metagenome TaxID=652676 RepID=A0A1W1CMN1_9ZZZZ
MGVSYKKTFCVCAKSKESFVKNILLPVPGFPYKSIIFRGFFIESFRD